MRFLPNVVLLILVLGTAYWIKYPLLGVKITDFVSIEVVLFGMVLISAIFFWYDRIKYKDSIVGAFAIGLAVSSVFYVEQV